MSRTGDACYFEILLIKFLAFYRLHAADVTCRCGVSRCVAVLPLISRTAAQAPPLPVTG